MTDEVFAAHADVEVALVEFPLGTRRAGLRPMVPADIDAFVSYWHDGGADLAHLGIEASKLGTRDDTRARFLQQADRSDPAAVGFTVTLEDRPVGFINVNVLGRSRGVPHFHLVDPSARKLGLMSAVLRAGVPVIIRVVREQTGASGLMVEVRTRNVGMNTVMQHLGHPIVATRYLSDPDGLAGGGEFNIYEID